MVSSKTHRVSLHQKEGGTTPRDSRVQDEMRQPEPAAVQQRGRKNKSLRAG